MRAIVQTFAALILLGLANATAAGLSLPSSLQVGGQALQPVSCGVRDTLWVEHYVVALYLPHRTGVLDGLRNPATAKALYVRILDDDHLPDEIPREWRDPMARYLDAQSIRRVQSAYGELRRGDTLTVTYEQGSGVRLIVNGREQAAASGHGMIEAVLRTWADGEPLREKLDRTVDDNRCAAG